MLSDHALAQERWAFRRRERERLPNAFGEFIAGLAPWDWFLNPISFRDDWRNAHRPPDRPSPKSGPPCPDEAHAYIKEFFADIERATSTPIGWMIAEEFGRLGGRWHAHGLVTGVSHLRRDFWWREAFRRFGRTRIEPFDPTRAAAFYAAKYSAKQLGAIHFGGTLRGIDLSLLEEPYPVGGGNDVIRSAELPKSYFRLGLKRWHR